MMNCLLCGCRHDSTGCPQPSSFNDFESLQALYIQKLGDLAAMDRRCREMERLLRRYRKETPLGHQPHMIAHEVDAVLGDA